MTPPGSATDRSNERPRLGRLGLEVLTAVLLGLVAVATAFASFAASEFDDRAAGDIALAERSNIDAASAYQAAFIVYNRDLEVFSELLRLDPALAPINDPRTQAELDAAATERDLLIYVLGSPAFGSAYGEWVEAQREGSDLSVFDNPDYSTETYAKQAALLKQAELYRLDARGNASLSNTMTHSTLIYAIALFLFGVAGVNRNRPVTLGLSALGVVVFATGIAISIPAAMQL